MNDVVTVHRGALPRDEGRRAERADGGSLGLPRGHRVALVREAWLLIGGDAPGRFRGRPGVSRPVRPRPTQNDPRWALLGPGAGNLIDHRECDPTAGRRAWTLSGILDTRIDDGERRRAGRAARTGLGGGAGSRPAQRRVGDMEAVLIRVGMVPGARSPISVARPGRRDSRSRCRRLILLAGRPRTGWERTAQSRLSRHVPDPQRLRPPTSAVIDRVGGRAGYRAYP